MKMADVNINLFGNYDKMDVQHDTGETIPFTPGGVIEEDLLGNQNEEHPSEGKLSQPDLKKYGLKGCIESYLQKQAKPQKHFILMISKS